MAVELYIEDELIDLIGDEDIATDYAIAEIGNFETRQGFRSIDFEIPKTANNKRILENSELINNLTDRPYRRLKARLYAEGIDQLIRFADIESVKESYSIRLYGGTTSFFEIVKKKKITEINLSDLNHTFNLSTIVASRTRIGTYIYPIIDYHSDSPNIRMSNSNNDFNVRFCFPSVSFNKLLASIVGDAGYGLQNNINLSDQQYQTAELLLPTFTNEYDDAINERFNIDASSNIAVTQQNIFVGPALTQTTFIQFNNIIDPDTRTLLETLTFNISGGTTVTRTVTTYTAAVDGVYNFKGVFNFNYVNVSNAALMFVEVLRINGSVATPIQDQQFEISSATPIGATVERSVNYDFNVTMRQGDKIFIGLFGAQISGFDSFNNGTLEIKPIEASFNFGDFIYLQYLLPNLKQGDLLKNYLQLYCAIIQVNEFTKLVQINKFNDVLLNIPNAVDWSDKIDYTEEPEITYALDEYAQVNNMLYDDDDLVIKPVGTDTVINIDDQTLEAENDFIELDFAATEMVTRLQGLQIPQIKVYETNDESPPQTTIEEEPEPRILLHEKISGNIDYTDGTNTTNVTTNIPMAWFIRADKTYNLGFENNLRPSYYTALEKVLDRTKVVNELVRLTPLDIYNLDFLIPVFISKHNSYFYISKISGYRYGSTESTEVELVKIK